MLTVSTFPVINMAQTGQSIERHRQEAGLSVRDLQNYFGFEYPQAIYKWQHGDCLPTVDNLLALSRVLNVSMEDLLVVDDREVILFPKAACKPDIEQEFSLHQIVIIVIIDLSFRYFYTSNVLKLFTLLSFQHRRCNITGFY